MVAIKAQEGRMVALQVKVEPALKKRFDIVKAHSGRQSNELLHEAIEAYVVQQEKRLGITHP